MGRYFFVKNNNPNNTMEKTTTTKNIKKKRKKKKTSVFLFIIPYSLKPSFTHRIWKGIKPIEVYNKDKV